LSRWHAQGDLNSRLRIGPEMALYLTSARCFVLFVEIHFVLSE
jgi:hypothetical protein